jgi:hypothetical protein
MAWPNVHRTCWRFLPSTVAPNGPVGRLRRPAVRGAPMGSSGMPVRSFRGLGLA